MIFRRFCAVLATAAVCLAGSTGASAAEIIELKSGHVIEGDVIADREDELIVDVGVEIIRVPTDRVRKRSKPEEKQGEVKAADGGFFVTADSMPKGSVRSLAAKFGEGVVLVSTPSGLGSGFIINSKGYCVTNFHVIENETRIAVTIFRQDENKEFEKRRIEEVKLIATNPLVDLALLQIPAQEGFAFAPTYLAAREDLVVGDPVFAIGNPLGLERSVSEGILSTKNRNMDGLLFQQTTTQINPGNSGGPLFNLRGEVVGVTSMKIMGGEGLGFAIPIDYVKHFLENRDAFAYDRNNPNNGFRYMDAPRRKTKRGSTAPAAANTPAKSDKTEPKT